MDVERTRTLFASVRQRPGMFLPAGDWRFITAIAYIEGWIEATDPKIGEALSAWLGEPSIAWWSTIAQRRFPEWTEPFSSLDPEADALLIGDLFDAFDGYLGTLA